MAALNEVHELIRRFARNQEDYRSPGYKEAHIRHEFIDPFFKALGWDVYNEKGYSPAYKSVVLEDAIKVGQATKAPDYSFRISGTRKFFLEAKKPTVNIKEDTHPAYQLRRYAWSAKLPLSILTDFEEFAVYDCRIQPAKTDRATTACIRYLKYHEYPQHWDFIVNTFSYDAVRAGSFDKFIKEKRGARGTTEVDASFLKEIGKWRELLARNIALRNPHLSQRELNYAVQRTIDRIIFLRICEDRGIERYGRLKDLLIFGDVYPRLCDLFKLADVRYNSGLFHFRPEKGRRESPDGLTLGLAIDDKVLKEIIRNLYYPESPYEFSVLPADILGQVYEQFLGKVIGLAPDHRAVVEDKPEVRKAGGVFYTPTYIVDYIVRQTVGKLVEGKRPGPGGGTENLKVADIACGSGSFLIRAYQFLLDWHREEYIKDGPEKWARGKMPRLYLGQGDEWQLTTAERKRILLDNIYGVDIDSQAVEVTKLSLLLKVLEGETNETLSTQLHLFRERVLPDLGNNIKCGNSLIEPDYYEGRQLSLELFNEEEMYRVNAFNWKAAFPSILGKGGFDAIIGNPPYGAYLSPDDMAYLLANFKLQSYQLDTYLLFMEKALDLLAEGGVLGMIIPNTWLLNLMSNEIRKYIFDKTQIENIVHYSQAVFPKVTVDTEVTIISRKEPSRDHKIQTVIVKKDGTIENYVLSQETWQARNGAPVNIFERPEYLSLANRLRSCTVLDEVCKITQGTKPFQVGKGKPHQTREIVNTKPFVAETPRDSTFRPLLRGSLIQRYQILWTNNYYISFGDWLAEPRYSAQYDAPAKIVIRQTGDSLVATLDCSQFIVRDNLYTIIPQRDEIDLRYILGLINSRLLTWFYQRILNPEVGEALAQVKRGHLAKLPIALPDLTDYIQKTRYDQMVSLVERILDLNKRLVAARTPQDKSLFRRQTAATDQQIDRLVYELYGLTEVEIKTVEEGAG